MATTILMHMKESPGIPHIHLKNAIDYILDVKHDGAKTDYGTFVGGNSGTDHREILNNFLDTKDLFGKRDGRQGYHFVVSFAPGETDKDTAFSVVKAFCEEYLGDASDIEQQEGRILRQGNQNAKVKIFRYVTEGTFDSYSWQLIENKQKFIGQIMTSKSPVRSCEDVDEAALSYAEVKALATGNPYIKEKMDLDIQVSRLKLMKANHTSQKYRLEDNITQHYPQQIAHLKESIEGFSKDIQRYKRNKPLEKEDFSITVCGKEYSDKKEAGTALIAICKESKDIDASVDVGEYLGFSLKVKFDAFYRKFVLNVKGDMSYPIEIGVDPFGNLTRINNALEAMPAELEEAQTKLANVEHQLETAKIEVNKPFLQEAELSEKLERLAELDALLNMGEKEDSIIENTTEDIIEPVITPANKFTKRVKPRGPKL